MNTLAMLGAEPILIVLAIVLILFGGSKIPELMRGIGQGVGELKRGVDDAKNTLSDATDPLRPKL